ncbi:MAG: small ribosomal subunit Rsm22 family protein [Parachlamydiaceae bacterium]|nr:small ribosomal subunit Rsm22 family protein [Parachlamydiaceae bacterium]
MKLPEELLTAIQSIISMKDCKNLLKAREELSINYRKSKSKQPFITSDIQRNAYVAARMPATFAAITTVFKSICQQIPDLSIKSLLDLGGGPGTAMWACTDLFPEIESITIIEKDTALASLGQKLANYSSRPAIKKAKWVEGDLEKTVSISPHDLVVFSYSIGELDPAIWSELLDQCWQNTNKLLVIIEPGTPAGFERIRLLRDILIKKGGYLLAPCPHSSTCPMKDSDWCHFRARVERSQIHRLLKGGDLGYEDEKFSYLVFSKQLFPISSSRVLTDPSHHSGHSKLKLCTPDGIQEPIVSKKMGEKYKEARKLNWGDPFSLI